MFDYQGEIGATDNFFALGGNSLLALAVATSAGINAQCIYENPIIRDLAIAIEQGEAETIQDESYVNDLIRETQYEKNETPVQNILLTGATGFLGAHVLYELVKKETPTITCLVRSKEKLKRVYKAYFNEELPVTVKMVTGDIGKKKSGLEENVYKSLVNEIDTVVHVAANVHHVGNNDTFMKTNYHGTEHMIEFCHDANAVLHYVSSYVSSGIAVVPIHSDVTTFTEQKLYIGQEYKKNIYVHTKYLSEVKILEERKKGLQANIYRMGCLTSRREDKVFQLNAADNGLKNRLRGLLKAGILTKTMEQSPIDFTAVDECANAFVRLIYSDKINRIYHMFNPNVLSMNEISSLCNRKLRYVSKEEFRNIMKEHAEDKEITELAFYTEMLSRSKPVHMKCDETVKTLKQLGFVWGKNTKDYIRAFVE